MLWLTQMTRESPTLPVPTSTPVGLTNIPEPMMLPTMIVIPLNKFMDLFNLSPWSGVPAVEQLMVSVSVPPSSEVDVV